MSWIRPVVGGENNEYDINVNQVAYVRYETVGDDDTGRRRDAILHMVDGKTFRMDPLAWEAVRGTLTPLAVRPN